MPECERWYKLYMYHTHRTIEHHTIVATAAALDGEETDCCASAAWNTRPGEDRRPTYAIEKTRPKAILVLAVPVLS